MREILSGYLKKIWMEKLIIVPYEWLDHNGGSQLICPLLDKETYKSQIIQNNGYAEWMLNIHVKASVVIIWPKLEKDQSINTSRIQYISLWHKKGFPTLRAHKVLLKGEKYD